MPIEYKNTSLIHAWQWAIGLEWYLLVEDPWRVVMSTDHPNGGSFLAYPQIIRLLMDRTYREDMLKTVPGQGPRAERARRTWTGEYTLVGDRDHHPGRARRGSSACKHKGHLGPGADADITIYTPDANQETMFELPRFVIKAGRVLVEQGEIREEFYGKTLHVAPEYDREVEPDIQKWFEDSYSIRWRNYPVGAGLPARPRSDRVSDLMRTESASPMTETSAAESARRSGRGHVRRGVSDDGRAGDRDGRHAGLGRDRRPDDDRLRHERDRLRRRGRHRARARARRNARRPPGREPARLRVQPRCAREGASPTGSASA